MNCENAQTSVGLEDGKAWEHFFLGDQYQFSNQIPNIRSYTRTEPGWVLADNGYCAWASTPPARIRQELPGQAAPTAANLPAAAASPADGGFGVLVLLAAVAAGGWWYMQRGAASDPNYSPHADLDWGLPALSAARPAKVLDEEIELPPGAAIPPGYELVADEAPPPVQGNSTHGIPSVEPLEFDRNSLEFEGNSHSGQNANSLGIPGVPADSQGWPPKSMGPAYDPLQPEQDGEFEAYRKQLDQNGLTPKGNDIIKALWGCTPGRSAAYEAARKRRDDFAKRLEYYRYEGA